MNKSSKKINQRACYNRISSWSPVPCEKPGPRASVTTITSAFGLGFCLLSPSGHVFHTARETMIKFYIIALWGWVSRGVLPVTCCEHGPPSIETVHFSKFSIATNILFNLIPFNLVKQVFRFPWPLFICVPWQPVHSNSANTLAPWSEPKIAYFKALKFTFMWIKHRKN